MSLKKPLFSFSDMSLLHQYPQPYHHQHLFSASDQSMRRGPSALEPPAIFPQGRIITAWEAIQRLRSAPTSLSAEAHLKGSKASSQPEDSPPQVVFFPTTNGGPGGEEAGPGTAAAASKCQDHAAQGNQFNIFAFLAFMLSVFNAIR